jgi:hypothetical protein
MLAASMRILILIMTLALALHVFAAACHATDGSREQWKSVDVSQGTDADVTLSEIHITCAVKGDSTQLRVERGKAGLTIDLERSATIYVNLRNRKRAIIQDRFASNEDRLLLCTLVGTKPSIVTLAHSDGSDYIHLHFSCKQMENDHVTVEESEYAGSKPSRSRTLTIRLDRDGYHVTRGNWRETP